MHMDTGFLLVLLYYVSFLFLFINFLHSISNFNFSLPSTPIFSPLAIISLFSVSVDKFLVWFVYSFVFVFFGVGFHIEVTSYGICLSV